MIKRNIMISRLLCNELQSFRILTSIKYFCCFLFILSLIICNVSLSNSKRFQKSYNSTNSPSRIKTSSKLNSSVFQCGVASLNKLGLGTKKSDIIDEDEDDSSYIAGGKYAPEGWFPWHAYLLCNNAIGSYCGGVIISPNRILTAAHCLTSKKKLITCNKLTIIAGTTENRRYPLKSTAQKRNGIAIAIPSGYVEFVRFDFAIIHLDKPFKFNDYVTPICLPTTTKYPISYDKCYISGSGRSDFKVKSLKLKYANMIHQPYCLKSWSPVTGPWICFRSAGNRTGATCKGDSGGPLSCKQKGNTWLLVGVVSLGHNKECDPQHMIHSIYTDVFRSRNYIQKLNEKLTKFVESKKFEKNIGKKGKSVQYIHV